MLDIADLDQEISSTESSISQISNSLSPSPNDSPFLRTQDDLDQRFTRKLKKFDTFLNLCIQESQKTQHLEALLKQSQTTQNQNPSPTPNSIICEKFDLSLKIRQIQQQISSLDSNLAFHRSSHPPISLPTQSNSKLLLSLALILLAAFIQLNLPSNFFS